MITLLKTELNVSLKDIPVKAWAIMGVVAVFIAFVVFGQPTKTATVEGNDINGSLTITQ